MFQKLQRILFGEARQPDAAIHIHESGQLALLSTQQINRRKLYERMAQHQRLIEVEEDLRRQF
jgi:hypothetical protein